MTCGGEGGGVRGQKESNIYKYVTSKYHYSPETSHVTITNWSLVIIVKTTTKYFIIGRPAQLKLDDKPLISKIIRKMRCVKI